MTKLLRDFPTVYFLTLKTSTERRKDLSFQLASRGVRFCAVDGFDGREVDIREQIKITGPFIGRDQISSEVLAVSVSHVKMVHQWLKDTDEPYAMFCEDDINFSLVDHWLFDFKEIIENLPADWKVFQMSLIKETPITAADMRIRRKRWNDWSCCAYLITREYAQDLIRDYYDEATDTYMMEVRGAPHHPIPENIIYPDDYRHCYVFPFFTENRNHPSTLIRENNYTDIESKQNQSSAYINSWWNENGSKVKIKETMKMLDKIPVIGAPVVNSTYWISRLIMSVDYPVENFVIINNNGRGEIDEELNRIASIKHPFIDNIKVVHMPANIGCAGAWNLIIKCYMLAPYWIITNDDVAFGPGLLKEMVDTLNSDPNIGMIHPNAGDFGIGAWDLFLIRESIVRIFGLFDENTYPAYCEDADYIMRMAHRPILKVIGLNGKYLHGHADSSMYYESGSQTQKNEKGLKEKLDVANDLNIEYLTRKWGPGWRKIYPNANPFEGEPAPISTTTWDIDFVRRKHLGF